MFFTLSCDRTFMVNASPMSFPPLGVSVSLRFRDACPVSVDFDVGERHVSRTCPRSEDDL